MKTAYTGAGPGAYHARVLARREGLADAWDPRWVPVLTVDGPAVHIQMFPRDHVPGNVIPDPEGPG